MNVTWYRSATVGISSKTGTTILCDPWITDGAFIGSWFHFPPLEGFEFQELVSKKWDALYISHLHADHFDRKLVSAIARNQPNCVVILPKFKHRWLYRAVKNCGFEDNRILEIENNVPHSILDFQITIFTADYCNPQICGVSTECFPTTARESALDSLALFEADGQRILNANDALAVDSASRLWPLIGKVDLLLGHYGGAGPYPQCFTMSNESKLIEANKLAKRFVSRLCVAADKLSATYVMPYAGQYVLSGSLSSLNKYRSVLKLSEALHEISKNSTAEPISLAPFSTFDLDSGSSNNAWMEPSEKDIDKYLLKISEHIYPYQLKDEIWDGGSEKLLDAMRAVELEYLKRFRLRSLQKQYSLSVKTESFGRTINFDNNKVLITNDIQPFFEKNTLLTLDERLLKRLIIRAEGYLGFTQFHFNQAEIGSHIHWERSGEYDSISSLLNFMQTYK